ncbi:outer membrane protein [Sphingomonas laterariae]|uniref:Outer membrane protein n=1 Tax=Edaphosphingomonas laterariae TaxID=861865 RepID=A0A239K720_9SPHN|nr:TolC family outer membrane protein [Sphingomonas laterariae]SNT13801.1 outer membrane protein [Sphingomonas laterariae]
MNRAFLLATAMLIATPAGATDLVEAWRAALAHDPTIAGARASRDAGQEAEVQAKALGRPTVQAQGAYQYNRVDVEADLPPDLLPSFSGARSNGRATIGVQAVQPIYDATKRAQAIQLREKSAAAQVQYSGEEQALILRVAEAYFGVLAGEDTLDSYQQQVAAAEEQRRGAQARFDAGRARITDVREAEARRDAAEAQRIAAQAALANAQSSFTELTGLSADDLRRPAAGGPPPALALSLDQASALAERQSPAVKVAEHNARAVGADVDRYRLGGRLVVEGVAGYQGQYRLGGESGSGILPDRIQSASAGIRVTIPLYAGGAIASKEREARSNATRATHDLAAARRDARLQARQAWYAATTGERRVEALRTARASAGLQQSAALTGREVGIRTQNDVLNAQSQSFSTDRDLNQAVYDMLVARLQLAAATGELGPDDVQRVNRLLEARATKATEADNAS